MTGANRRLPMLPLCVGLVVGLGALACSDRRDENAARTSSEYGTAATPAATDTATVVATTPDANANVQADRSKTEVASEPAVPARRSTARRSTPAVASNDPYAAPRESAPAAPSRAAAPTETAATDQPIDDRAAANRSTEQNRTGVEVAANPTPSTSDSVSRIQLENAGVLPKGPTLNDHQVMNIVLLANAGDSARAADILGDAARTTTVASGEVAMGNPPAPPAPAEAAVTVRSESASVTTPAFDRSVCMDPANKAKECATLPPTSASVTIESDQSKAPVTSYDEGRSVAPPAPAESNVAEISMDAVRSLASTMLRDHTALNARASAVAQGDNLVPTESAVSVDVFNSNREIKSEDVEDLNPAAREWLTREVRLHEEALALIESQLLPLASDDELKALLEEERQKIQSHLSMARQLLGTPATGTPVPLTPSATPDANHQEHMAPAPTPAPATPDTLRTKP